MTVSPGHLPDEHILLELIESVALADADRLDGAGEPRAEGTAELGVDAEPIAAALLAALGLSARDLVEMRRDRAMLLGAPAPEPPCDFVARLVDRGILTEPPPEPELPTWVASPPIRLGLPWRMRLPRLPLLPGPATLARLAIAAVFGAAATAAIVVLARSGEFKWPFEAPVDRSSTTLAAGGGDAPRSAARRQPDRFADADLHHAAPSVSGPRFGSGSPREVVSSDGGARPDAPAGPAVSEVALVVTVRDPASAASAIRTACRIVDGSESMVALVRNFTLEEANAELLAAIADARLSGSEAARLERDLAGLRASGPSGDTRDRAREHEAMRELVNSLGVVQGAPPRSLGRSAAPARSGSRVARGERLHGSSGASPAPDVQLSLSHEGFSHAITADAATLARILETLPRDGSILAVRFIVRDAAGVDSARRPGATESPAPSVEADPWRSWKLAVDTLGRDGSEARIVPIRFERGQ
ncbi:MAG TPA: hypothetical protein PKC43_03340 [Phycisphaerales bacterium]|nr:hypothetical protein [Phycisphaerales bacterium]HMP36463.1 hypothetical protein [Phycisphaerales bacterium]